jgi:DNA-directed RNA polymerase subunit M/transcription elongation factor TFIIS
MRRQQRGKNLVIESSTPIKTHIRENQPVKKPVKKKPVTLAEAQVKRSHRSELARIAQEAVGTSNDNEYDQLINFVYLSQYYPDYLAEETELEAHLLNPPPPPADYKQFEANLSRHITDGYYPNLGIELAECPKCKMKTLVKDIIQLRAADETPTLVAYCSSADCKYHN